MQNYRLYYEKLTWHDPEKVFLALYGNKNYTFWLDNNSIIQSPANNYSYIGIANKRIKYSISNHTITISNNGKIQRLRQNIFTYLKEKLSTLHVATGSQPMRDNSQLPFDFTGGFVGYFGYEMRTECDSSSNKQSDFRNWMQCKEAPRSGVRRTNDVRRERRFDEASPLTGTSEALTQQCAKYGSRNPDAFLFLIDKFLAFDHSQKCLYLVCLSKNKNKAMNWLSTTKLQLANSNLTIQQFNNPHSSPVTFTPSQSRRQYLKNILTCQKHLTAGDAYQLCLTNQITANIKTDWLKLFLTLRRTNPAPASAYINFGNFALISSSPEQFLHVDKKGWVTSKPMKGTIQRGDTQEKDLRLAKRLGKTKKDYAENIMIVDLVRNDLGKVCVVGSIKVTKPLEVQTYSTVHQLVSTIKGKLRPDATVIDLLKATFPGGSMTGAPKIAACKIINELEKAPRGIYSGAFGFLSLNGTANLAMTIRTIIAAKNNLSFGSGGAILSDSIPQEEYNEMLLKAQPLIAAIIKSTGRGDSL